MAKNQSNGPAKHGAAQMEGPVFDQAGSNDNALTKTRRGRPRKFSRPARSVTLTLPADVIASLQQIDTDLSRAVVRALQAVLTEYPRPTAELVRFGRQGVILVPPSRALKERTGIELVPLSDGRALLSFEGTLSVSEFELRLRDALDDPALLPCDRVVFEELAQILKGIRRRGSSVTLRQRSIIVLQWRGSDLAEISETSD